jgi:hypothetical protein
MMLDDDHIARLRLLLSEQIELVPVDRLPEACGVLAEFLARALKRVGVFAAPATQDHRK